MQKSSDLDTVTGWGWNEFLDLDKLFDRSLKYLGEKSAMKLVMEVNLLRILFNKLLIIIYFSLKFSILKKRNANRRSATVKLS
jgi:hypothetical protein